MKKSQKKSSKKTEEKKFGENVSLGDLGLEPPKIYRESQKMTKQTSSQTPSQNGRNKPKGKTNSKNNLTRQEKRQKDNKKRKKRNILRKVMIWLVVVVAFLAVGVVLSLTVFFHIESITVLGNERYSQEEILKQCTIDNGENLFLSDTDSAKRLLEKNLPYIYTAQIKRKLPSTIEINITEATPAYSIRNKDKTYILLDDKFKVLENKAEKAQGILIQKATIANAELGESIEFEKEDIGECLTELANTVKSNSFENITAIYSNSIIDNYVVYDKRIKFKLGNCDNLENKIYQGLAACEKLNQTNPNAKGTMNITGDKSLYFTEE